MKSLKDKLLVNFLSSFVRLSNNSCLTSEGTKFYILVSWAE